MAEDGLKQRMRHKEKLGDIVQHLKNGVYLSCIADSAYGQSIIWASERIAELEAETPSPEVIDKAREAFFSLGIDREKTTISYCEAIAWGKNCIKQLELENENLSKTILAISSSPLLASPESDEEIHQRRRRERMLDEITLICVRDRIEQLIDADGKQNESGATTGQRWGRNSRDTADNICRGINGYDAAH